MSAFFTPQRGYGWLRVIMLMLTVTLLWCGLNGRLSLTNWNLPLNYFGDSLEILTHVKAASEGDLIPFRPQTIHRLGMPFEANWSEYPVSDKLLFYSFGLVARFFGLMVASNFALLISHITSALAFYFCARFLRHRWEWSAVGALLFSFTFHSLSRGLPHLALAFTYTVPLAILVSWLVASGRLLVRQKSVVWFCMVTSVVLGISNPYNLFFFLQLVSLAVLFHYMGERRKENLNLGLACLVVALGTYGIFESGTWLYSAHEGATAVLVRNYGGTERYALKMVELFLPPTTHHLKILSDLGYRYLRWTDFRGEPFSPYLGMIGIIGFWWVLAEALKKLQHRPFQRLPGHSLQIGWTLFYSSVGALNNVFALFFGLQIFRATNRYSIFISALVLLFLVSRMSRLTRRWARWASVAVALVVLAVGLYDQLPISTAADDRTEIAKQVKNDRDFGERLENSYAPGSMFFQLPVLDFPESQPIFNLTDYQHFRPYFFTETMRFSYAMLKGRASARWQHDYEKLPPAKLAKELEAIGFSGIYIDRKGYAGAADKLLKALAEAGYEDVLKDGDDNVVVVRLKPSAHPGMPLASGPTLGQGWNPATLAAPNVRWSNGSAVMSYYNPYSYPLKGTLSFNVRAVNQRPFSVQIDGVTKFETELSEAVQSVDIEKIELAPGVTRIDFDTSEPAIRISQQPGGLHAFGVGNWTFKVDNGPTPGP